VLTFKLGEAWQSKDPPAISPNAYNVIYKKIISYYVFIGTVKKMKSDGGGVGYQRRRCGIMVFNNNK